MTKAAEELAKTKNVDYSILNTAFGLHDGLDYYNKLVTENNRLTPSEYRLLRNDYFGEDIDRENC